MGNFPEGAARGGYPTVRGVHLLPPLDYLAFINLMRQAGLVLTDSGGVIEEAATLRKPLLIRRRGTKWPEAVAARVAWWAPPGKR